MNSHRNGLVIALLAGWCCAACLIVNPASARAGGENSPATPSSASPQTFWIIPHTHWEGAVFKTREEYLEIGLPHILTALSLLRAHPEWACRLRIDQLFASWW